MASTDPAILRDYGLGLQQKPGPVQSTSLVPSQSAETDSKAALEETAVLAPIQCYRLRYNMKTNRLVSWGLLRNRQTSEGNQEHQLQPDVQTEHSPKLLSLGTLGAQVAATLFSKGVFGRVWQRATYGLECEVLPSCYSYSWHGTWPMASSKLDCRNGAASQEGVQMGKLRFP